MESHKKTKSFCNVYIPPPARERLLKQNQELSGCKTNQEKTQSNKKKSPPKHDKNALKDDSVLPLAFKVPLDSGKLCEKQCTLNSKECESGTDICEESSSKATVSTSDLDGLCDSLSKKTKLNGRLKKKTDFNQNKCEEFNRNVKLGNVLNTKVSVKEKSKPILNVKFIDSQSLDQENETFKHVWEKLVNESQSCSEIKSKSTTKIYPTSKGRVSCDLEELNENCIIEIYDFPEELKTRDLLSIFSAYINRGLKIRWVDDTHALGLLPSEVIAYEVLNVDLPVVKTRSLSHAIPLSKEKAKQLMPPPPPPRPITCSASARRLVSGALGIKAVFTKAEIEAERELLKVAREQKTLAAKQREAV